MEKVKVTKEVAEAINEIIKRNNGNKAYAIVGFTNRPFSDKKLTPLNEITDGEGVQAIYFGYEVEQTTDDKIRERYKKHSGYIGAMERRDEMRWTLDVLGIRVGGVNA